MSECVSERGVCVTVVCVCVSEEQLDPVILSGVGGPSSFRWGASTTPESTPGQQALALKQCHLE